MTIIVLKVQYSQESIYKYYITMYLMLTVNKRAAAHLLQVSYSYRRSGFHTHSAMALSVFCHSVTGIVPVFRLLRNCFYVETQVDFKSHYSSGLMAMT